MFVHSLTFLWLLWLLNDKYLKSITYALNMLTCILMVSKAFYQLVYCGSLDQQVIVSLFFLKENVFIRIRLSKPVIMGIYQLQLTHIHTHTHNQFSTNWYFLTSGTSTGISFSSSLNLALSKRSNVLYVQNKNSLSNVTVMRHTS